MLTDVVLASLNPEFDRLYKASGRPSIAPEYILRALLLQVFYSVRSDARLYKKSLCENLNAIALEGGAPSLRFCSAASAENDELTNIAVF
jgi:transposase